MSKCWFSCFDGSSKDKEVGNNDERKDIESNIESKAVESNNESKDEGNVSEANTQFGLDLLQVAREEKKTENVFLSPFSISVALAMTQLGAREKTAAEMASTLRWNVRDETKIHKEFQKCVDLLQSPSTEYWLSLVNRVYIEKAYGVLEEFTSTIKELYRTEPIAANFVTDSEDERVKINDWVEQQTYDKIKDFLAPGVLTSLTRMVLVNAVYFKGFWKNMFNYADTRPGPFKVSPSTTKEVWMMHATLDCRYKHFDNLECATVELLYKGNALSMVIILPDNDFGLEKLLSDLNGESLCSLLKSQDWPVTEVQLAWPKFKVTSSFSLSSALQSLGMKDAFSEEANFGGITREKDLLISEVVHKASIMVDEEGTEAAAASGMNGIYYCLLDKAITIVSVDHPFLFAIQDRRSTNMVLFLGAFVNPSEEDTFNRKEYERLFREKYERRKLERERKRELEREYKRQQRQKFSCF